MEAAERLFVGGDGAGVLMEVELGDFGAGAGAGVLDGAGDGEGVGGFDGWCGEGEMGVGEGRVGQAVAEGVEGGIDETGGVRVAGRVVEYVSLAGL